MKAAAKAPPPFFLRAAGPPDQGFLLRLYASTREAELARTGWNGAQRDEFLRGQFEARRADYRHRFPGAEDAIIVVEGADAGAWTVWKSPGEIRLVNIELLPSFRGRGVGSALIRGLLAESVAKGTPLGLSVHESNRDAQRLYQRIGFRPATRANGYIPMGISPVEASRFLGRHR